MVLTPSAALIAAVLMNQTASSTPSTIIMGESPARACYDAARWERTGAADVRTCRAALDDPRLTRRDRAATFANLGLILRQQGNAAEAITAYTAAIEIAPDLAEAWLNRGAAYLGAGELVQARSDLDQALLLGLARPELAYVNRALLHEANDDLTAAYADLQRAIEIAPDFQPALDALSRYEVVRGGADG